MERPATPCLPCLLLSMVGLSCVSPGALPAALVEDAAPLRATAACSDGQVTTERLVVDWSSLDRSKLEATAHKGLVPVRLDGCEARLVDHCVARRGYAYMPTSRQRELVVVRGHDELRARLPLGAARFGATLDRSRELRVTMTVVGRWEAPLEAIGASDLEGECEGATHYIASVAVGAFEIAAKSAAEVGVEADVAALDARAESKSERQRLDSAGVEARCSDGKRGDNDPPSDCAVPLRLEVRRLGAAVASSVQAHETVVTSPQAQLDVGLRRAVAMTRSEVAPCYRRAAELDPRLDGWMSLVATVDRDGHVSKVAARYDVTPALADCAMSRAARVLFPPAADAAPRLFVLPLVFKGAEASGAPRSAWEPAASAP
jgi:hypothetical protein